MKKKEEITKNPLLEAINQITNANPEMQTGEKSAGGIVDIITFCDSPQYLDLPNSNFNLWLPQRVILKTFYMGSRGNENLKLSKEEWEWLYANNTDEERDGVVYEKNVDEVIDKIQRKEKEGFNFLELHLCAGRRGSKCRSENDRIATTEGSLTFRELCDRINTGERIGITTYDQKTLKRHITYDIKAKDNGIVDCFEIETKRGIRETSSWNHPYLVWRDKWTEPRFIKMNELLIGDRIAVADCTELFGRGGIGSTKAALLGHLQGDGGTTHQIRYTTACPTMLNDFKELISLEFPKYEVKYVGEQYDYTVVKKTGRFSQDGSQRNEVKEWLKSINCFGKKSIHKEIPECIYKGSKKEVAAFLSRLFGCDGWASTEINTSKKHKGTPSSSIGYSSSSRSLIDGVRHLLLKFGIHCTISKNDTKLNGKLFHSWSLRIKRQECMRKFEKEINIFSKENKVKKATSASGLRIKANSEFDGLPMGIWRFVTKTMKERKLSGAEVLNRYGRGYNDRLRKKYSPNRSKILSYGINIEDKFLKDMGESDVRWDEIKTVTNVGSKKTVDLEVKGTHIIGGDILSHNTIIASVISAYEAYKLIKIGNGNPHRFYGIPDDEDIAIINVALSKDQAGRLFGHMQSRLRNSKFFQGRIARETTSEIRLYTDTDLQKKADGGTLSVQGSIVIVCGHSNPDTLRGYSTILILFDELAFYDESGKTTGSAFYSALEPSTRKFKRFGDGRLVEISSPNTSVGIFYDIFRSAKTANHILSFQLPTWCINKDISYESLAEERKRNQDNFVVEYGAQWAKSGIFGNYFDSGLVDRCIRGDITPHRRPERFNYFLHVDPANGGDRYVAVLVAKEYYKNQFGKRRSRVRLANIFVWLPEPGVGLLFNEIDKQVLQICKTFHVLSVSYDQWNCPMADEYLYTKRGLIKAKDIIIGDTILSKSGVYNNVKNLRTKKNVDGYKISTKFGYTLEANDIHPIFVKDKGFIAFKDLKIGDKVCLNENQYNFGLINDPDKALMAGYLISEGYIGDKDGHTFTIGFTNTNSDVLADYKNIAEKITGKTPITQDRYKDHKTYKDAIVYNYRDKKSISIIMDFIGKQEQYGSECKVVPNFVMRGNKKTVSSFLSSLYEGDGHISLNPNVLNIEYDTTSKILAKEIQILLLGLGIKSSLKYYTNKFFKGRRFPFYRISIYGENILVFDKEIGFRSRDKKEKIKKAVVLQKSDKRLFYNRKNKGMRKEKNRQTSRSMHMWDKIVSIEPKVIDIVNMEVDGDHTYISNGIVSHNSIQSLQMLKSYGVNTIQTSYNRTFKNKIYQNLKDMMTYQPFPELWLYDDSRLILEMKALKFRPTMRGVSLVTDKHGEVKTDDLVDCLAGAAAMASENIRQGLPAPVTAYTGQR